MTEGASVPVPNNNGCVEVSLWNCLLENRWCGPGSSPARNATGRRRPGRTGVNLVAALVQEGVADEGRVMAFVAERFGLEEVNLRPADVDEAAFGLLPLPLLKKRRLLPLACTGSVLDVAMSDPTDLAAMDEIRFMTGHDVRTVLARRPPSSRSSTIVSACRATRRGCPTRNRRRPSPRRPPSPKAAARSTASAQPAGDAPVVALVDSLMKDAVARGASDIHVEPYDGSVRVRFRIDGILREIMTPPYEMKQA